MSLSVGTETEIAPSTPARRIPFWVWPLALAAILVVGGANVTTQLFKAYWPTSPHLWDNSLPSGHSTVAMSLSLAAILVAPSGARRWLVPFAAFGATFVGAGTIVGHWHRPADVWAALLAAGDPAPWQTLPRWLTARAASFLLPGPRLLEQWKEGGTHALHGARL